MSVYFTNVPVRINGPTVTHAWFNALRTAGIALELIVTNMVGLLIGAGGLTETSFTIANNQSSAADITGLLFNPASVRSFIVEYEIYRNTTGAGATERAESGILSGIFSTVAGTWEFNDGSNILGNAGCGFTITNAGQIKYTSDNQTGTAASSVMKFRARTFAV